MRIQNPIVIQRADPCVLRHDRQYLFTASHPKYDRIILRRASGLNELQSADEVTIWTKHRSGPQSHLIWAPEIHRIDDAWYIYYAAAPHAQSTVDAPGAAPTFDHRIFVLENRTSDPLRGAWVGRGQLNTGWESFALDAPSFHQRGSQYLAWAQQDTSVAGHSNIYIARMSDPWTLESEAVMLSRPEYDWECRGFSVNEGPSVLAIGGTLYLTYSASATGTDYAMGLLTADVDSDLLDSASWRKSSTPVFGSNPEAGQFGPGHNSFTTTADGRPVLVYHARNYTNLQGEPLWDPNRHARAQVLLVDDEGRPQWGSPSADTRPTPDSVEVLPARGLA